MPVRGLATRGFSIQAATKFGRAENDFLHGPDYDARLVAVLRAESWCVEQNLTPSALGPVRQR
jgi:hypothetical protein